MSLQWRADPQVGNVEGRTWGTLLCGAVFPKERVFGVFPRIEGVGSVPHEPVRASGVRES